MEHKGEEDKIKEVKTRAGHAGGRPLRCPKWRQGRQWGDKSLNISTASDLGSLRAALLKTRSDTQPPSQHKEISEWLQGEKGNQLGR